MLAAGAVLVFVAVALVSKYFVGPVAATLGWPLQKLSPISGRLARDNTQRNPGRTAATASALMIGLGVVVFVAVFAQGLKSSFIDSVDKMVTADYVISGGNFLTLPEGTTRRVESVPNIDVAAGLNAQQVQANGNSVVALYGVDPGAFGRVWQMDWLNGDDALHGKLTAAVHARRGADGRESRRRRGRHDPRRQRSKGARPSSRCSACTVTRRCSTDSS